MHRVVPELIIENYRAGRFSGEFPAIGMFLDLTGFSTMTDALMHHGQHGAEVLSGLMHGVFDPLVENIFDHGGKIVSFAGDGIMALYPIDSDEKTTALRALAAADAIQKRLVENPTRQTVYGKFPISVRIGLAKGSVSWGILRSDDDKHAAYYFRGPAVDDSARAEHQARAGEIVVTENLNDLLKDVVQTEPFDSFHRFSRFRIEISPATRNALPEIDLGIARLFMPEEVIAHDVRGEFRQIVNLFMRFPDLSDEMLQSFMRTVLRLKEKYGGLLTRLDFGDKGCNMLILWGAPTAYGNDIGRALNFTLELKAKVDFPITAGVTYYIAHAGYLGSVMCEDYTCYGWGVNLASRFMMNAANGQTWVDDRIARRVSKRFEIEYVGIQRFKGFAEEQKVHLLHGLKRTPDAIYQGEIIGREDELARLAGFIESLWQNNFAGVLLVYGDAGIGKGRLMHEFRTSELFERHNALWVVCQSNQILRESFNPLRGWLLRYFGFAPDQNQNGHKQIFDSKLDDLIASTPDPELVRELERTRSSLGALVDVRWAGSLYEQLDGEGRYNNTFLALVVLLKAESLRQPLVFLLEDLHFTDEDSKAFVPRLKRAIQASKKSYPMAILMTSRPQGLADILEENTIDARINLPGLPMEALGRLAENMLGSSASVELAKFVTIKSEGNPFFAEQIIRYLREENFIEMSNDGWTLVKRLSRTVLPGDVRAILVARLDQLTREIRECIQTAAVLGREFEIHVLAQMLSTDEMVIEHVAEAERASIWGALNEIRYIFTHGLLRDAAYAMQMRARRLELHALALDALEQYYADNLKNHYAELAYHAENASLRMKAQKYYTLAGNASSDLFQNSQAVEYYTRALAFTPFDDLAAQFDLLSGREELFNRLGNRTAQSQDLDSLEKLAHQLGGGHYLVNSLKKKANYHFVIGEYQPTIEIASQAVALAQTVGDTDSKLHILWSSALLRIGKPDEAMQQASMGLQLARNSGQPVDEAKVLTVMGLIALEQKDPAVAHQYLEESLFIARAMKERRLESYALNNLAISEGSVKGNYALAAEYYEQVYKIAKEIGDRYQEAIAMVNLGFVAGMQGNITVAYLRHEHALMIAREIGNRYFQAYTLINLSAAAGVQNEAAVALQYAQQAADLSREIFERAGEAWAMLYMGHAYLLQDEFQHAQTAYHKSIEIRNELGQLALSMEPIAGLVETALRMNDLETASQETEKILAYFEGGGSLEGAEEPLRVYHACYQFLSQQKDPRAQQVLQIAKQLLEAQVSKFKDEQARKLFIENFPWRRALHSAANH